MFFLTTNSVTLVIAIALTVFSLGSLLCSLTESFLIFERNNRTSGWTFESCCFTGLTLSNFRGKTIVVVGRVVPEPYIFLMSERAGLSSTHSGTMYPRLQCGQGFSLNRIWYPLLNMHGWELTRKTLLNPIPAY